MAYPVRPTLAVLAEFVGTALTRQTAEQRARLLSFCTQQYKSGRSIHELAELTGRSQAAVRRALDQAEVAQARTGSSAVSQTVS